MGGREHPSSTTCSQSKLARRGLVREGYAVDLVVLDPTAVADHRRAGALSSPIP